MPSGQALADNETLPDACLTEKTAAIHASFNETAEDPAVLKQKWDVDIKDVQSQATEIGVMKIVAGGLNYTINAEPQALFTDGAVDQLQSARASSDGVSAKYRLVGNVNYLVMPSTKGLELLRLLLAKKMPVSLSFVEVNKSPGLCRLNASTGKWE
jgi:hypothetical protein